MREKIKAGGVHLIDSIDIALVNIAVISLPILCPSGNCKGFQLVFIDGLAPEGIGLAIYVIMIGRAFIVLLIASGFDIRSNNIRS